VSDPLHDAAGWHWEYALVLTWPDGTRRVRLFRGRSKAEREYRRADRRGTVAKLMRRRVTYGPLEEVPNE
jgi:hypothetical protein